MRGMFGENDPSTLRALSLMGLLLYDDGKLSEAESYYREALAIQRRVLGNEHPDTLAQIHNIGLLLMYQHKLDQAEPFVREAEQKMRRVLGDDHPNTLMAICNLGYLLEREGRLDQAESYEREALTKARRALGEDHPVTLVAIMLTGMVLEKKGEHAEAEKLLAPADAVTRKVFTGSNAFLRATFLDQLGLARTGLGEYAIAEGELLEAQSIFRQTHNVTHNDDVRDCTRALVALYAAWNRAEPGKGYDAKAAAWGKKLDALAASGPAPVTR
jgi:tetratricopeptide (TPR) repeat protein